MDERVARLLDTYPSIFERRIPSLSRLDDDWVVIEIPENLRDAVKDGQIPPFEDFIEDLDRWDQFDTDDDKSKALSGLILPPEIAPPPGIALPPGLDIEAVRDILVRPRSVVLERIKKQLRLLFLPAMHGVGFRRHQLLHAEWILSKLSGPPYSSTLTKIRPA